MQQPLITLSQAGVERSGIPLIHGVDWRLEPGEHWALLGGNGAGKTTLMRLARGDVPPTSGERDYCFDGAHQTTPIGIRHRMALVSPELAETVAGSGWRVTGRDLVLAGFFDSLLLYQPPTEAMRLACERTLEQLGLTRLAEARVGGMSTGELKKMLVARALASGPDLLFLDECMDGLDARSRRSLLAVLERASAWTQLVVAAHRPEEIPSCVNRALLLRQGRVVLVGGPQEVLSAQQREDGPEAPPPTSTRGDVPEGLGPTGQQSGPEIFSLRRGGHVLAGKTILENIDWTVNRGECWALTGENGAGKSTLVRLVLGLADPLPETTLGWWGKSGLPDMTEVRRRVGLVSSELKVDYEYDLTVREVVFSGFFGSIGLYERPSAEQRARAHEAMAFFGVDGLADRRLSQLSQGQARRTLLARAVAPGPELLFLDEPTAGLDHDARVRALGLLQGLAASGMPMVLVTHHEDEIIPAVNRRLQLERGRVVVMSKS